MMNVRHLLVLAAAPLLFADGPAGVPPRGSSSDYPAHAVAGNLELGAVAISPEQVRRAIGRSLTDYLVFEVALYPVDGNQVDVSPKQFMLQVGEEGNTISAVDADVIVPPRDKPMSAASKAPSKVHVENEDTIGYASGPYNRGVYTDTRVGVGVGDPGPQGAPMPPPDPKLDERRAVDQRELPDTKTSKPIAGLLYFPKPKAKQKSAGFELVYYGTAGQTKLTVPRSGK